jgi:hypothetical protein
LLGHEVVVRALPALAASALGFASALAGCGLAGCGLAGCGAVESSTTPETEHQGSLEGHATRRPPTWDMGATPAPACEEPAPLLVHHDGAGRVDRLHARLTARGVLGSFLVDTGSLKSFVTHSGTEDSTSASTVIFCQTTTLPIIARLRPGSTPDGAPQAGVLGSDLVAHGAVLDLDLAKGTLSWYQPAKTPPAGAVVLPIEYRNGWLVASGIRLHGRDVKLVVDTGASNVIVVDKTPRANEVREDTVDGTASPIVLFHGTDEIAFGDGRWTRHVPVDRTDSFPTLEGLIAQLGGDVAGLLGLTSLGRERIIIGKESLVFVLPASTPSPL